MLSSSESGSSLGHQARQRRLAPDPRGKNAIQLPCESIASQSTSHSCWKGLFGRYCLPEHTAGQVEWDDSSELHSPNLWSRCVRFQSSLGWISRGFSEHRVWHRIAREVWSVTMLRSGRPRSCNVQSLNRRITGLPGQKSKNLGLTSLE